MERRMSKLNKTNKCFITNDFKIKKLAFFTIDTAPTMIKDSLESSHPISVEVTNPNEINSIFDSISYDKVNLKEQKIKFYNQ
jgi:hypothetical protein